MGLAIRRWKKVVVRQLAPGAPKCRIWIRHADRQRFRTLFIIYHHLLPIVIYSILFSVDFLSFRPKKPIVNQSNAIEKCNEEINLSTALCGPAFL